MFRSVLVKVGAAGVGLALSLTAAAGTATAEPDMTAVVNMTCSYPQVMAALDAESPEAAAQLNASPQATAMLQSFINSPPAKRQRMLDKLQRNPKAQQYADQYVGLVMQVIGTCNNY